MHLRDSLREKVSHYQQLKTIIEQINQNLSLDSLAEDLVSIAFSLVGKKKGVCILYLTDKESRPNLFKTKKENKDLIIKAKEGDIFDFWVIKHATSLLVEDIHKDFRFDPDKLSADAIQRGILSLISCPIISPNNRFLGILRLDNPKASFYTQDDLRFLLTLCDIAAVALENVELFVKTQELAIHDELTALYTKGYFLSRLKEECLRTTRHNRMLSLLMLDIDYFKNYNDRFGHNVGDIVLKTLSQIMVDSLRDRDVLIGRFGGEEFVITLCDIDKDKAKEIAEDLRKQIEEKRFILRRQESHVTVSIGVATFPQDAKDENELIMKADKAMYLAKVKGRNRVWCI
ncbi:MAG: sensor domain-containing diguanylate cyclase [Candidatus Omnitrophica bacterium]|nr:sensor domain-containing diguanylate cyclase [Candidatus Omnitrophota bacterium]